MTWIVVCLVWSVIVNLVLLVLHFRLSMNNSESEHLLKLLRVSNQELRKEREHLFKLHADYYISVRKILGSTPN